MKLVLAALCVAVLGGCTAVTDVISIGPYTYLAASHGVVGNGSSEARKAAAMEAADAWCKERASLAAVIRSKEVETAPGEPPSWQVEFQCQKLL